MGEGGKGKREGREGKRNGRWEGRVEMIDNRNTNKFTCIREERQQAKSGKRGERNHCLVYRK